MDQWKTLTSKDSITIVENLIKLEIFEKNEDFKEKMLFFKKKNYFLRNNKINKILDIFSEIQENYIYGWIHDDFRTDYSIPLSDIIFTVEDIFLTNNKYYAYIKYLKNKKAEIYKKMDPNQLYLRPEYDYNGDIYSLTIEIKREVINKRILNRK